MLGPVISEAQYNRIQGFIQNGIDDGATLVTGGLCRQHDLPKGDYVRPTVFGNVTRSPEAIRRRVMNGHGWMQRLRDLEIPVIALSTARRRGPTSRSRSRSTSLLGQVTVGD
ncbi:hypothetical protein OKW43_006765 [Paraburkholderia sp. WC7.3g]